MKIAFALTLFLSFFGLIESMHHKPSLWDIVEATDDLATLQVAIETAGLKDILDDCDAGPFTVFAPQNKAFKKIDEAVLASLLDNPDELQKIILYHAVPGKIKARNILHGNVHQADKTKHKDNGDIVYKGVETANPDGEELTIKVKDHGKKVKVDKATVKAVDIMACNGIGHVINKVLVP